MAGAESPWNQPETRDILERKLAELVVALRDEYGDGNITVRIPDTGDFVAILQVNDSEATDLAKLLGPPR